MSLYLGLFLFGTFLLAFWVLPALIAAMAPVGHREVLHELRAAVAISAVTTLSVAALPFITDATRKLGRPLRDRRRGAGRRDPHEPVGRLSARAARQLLHLLPFMPAERAQRFRTREQILAMRPLRIGVFDDPVLRPLLARLLPNAEIVVVPDYRALPDFGTIDAAIWTLEQAGALARANAGITAVVPKDLGSPFFFTYLMPPDSQEMVHFVNYWLAAAQGGRLPRARDELLDRRAAARHHRAALERRARRARLEARPLDRPGPTIARSDALRPRGISRSSRGRARARSRGPVAARSSRRRSPAD